MLNSYFGDPLGYVDDLAWMEQGGNAYVFFTVLGNLATILGGAPSGLSPAIWRFDAQRGTLQPVIPQSDVQFPNGVRVNAAGTKLYVGIPLPPHLPPLVNVRHSYPPSLISAVRFQLRR